MYMFTCFCVVNREKGKELEKVCALFECSVRFIAYVSVFVCNCRAEMGAKEVGFWQQNSKKLELLISDLQLELKNAEKKYVSYKTTSEQILNDALKKERQKFEIELQQRLASSRQRGAVNENRVEPAVVAVKATLTKEVAKPTGNVLSTHTHKTSTEVYNGIIEDLRVNLSKKDVIIQRLATQLALARGHPVLEVIKEGYDSLGHELDMLKQKQIYGAKVVDQMVSNHNSSSKGLKYACVNDILEEYEQTMNEPDDYEENQSQNSYEMKQQSELVKVKRIVLQDEVNVQLDLRHQEQELDKTTKMIGKGRPSSAPSVIRHIRETRNFAPRDTKKVTLLEHYEIRQQQKNASL